MGADGRTAKDRTDMIATEMLRLRVETAGLRTELRQAERDAKKFDELRAAAIDAEARAELAEKKASAWEREVAALIEAGFLPDTDAEVGAKPAGEMWGLAQRWVDEARALDKEEGKHWTSGRREALRECAAALQRLSRKMKSQEPKEGEEV